MNTVLEAPAMQRERAGDERVNWVRSIPFLLIHAAVIAVFFVGVSWTAVAVCIALYALRMFAVTAGYHRLFSHRSFKTTRVFQFILGWIATSATQKGPLWWAANHRHHHATSDTEEDAHSPKYGFWWSHVGWFLCKKFHSTNYKLIPDLTRFRELRFLNRCYVLPPITLALGTAALGWGLHRWAPSLHTNTLQMLVWGYFVSTVLLYHGTFVVNSLAHVIGRRRFATKDDSRNSFLIAIVTLGEGWHNNHHFVPSSERQGFYWWEVDITHYTLKLLSWLGIVWDLNVPPRHIYALVEAQRQEI